jgi:hypothetical protein
MPERVCPFCGKPFNVLLNRCPYCREDVPRGTGTASAPIRRRSSSPTQARENVRRGLLWALLAGVLYYFASGASPLKVPIPIPEFVTLYLLPLVFLAGGAMALYGLFQSMRS